MSTLHLSEETRHFITQHAKEDTRLLALKKAPHNVDLKVALQQIEGAQLAQRKLPSWADNAEILFPPRLAMEQCSSEATAEAKQRIAKKLLKENTKTMVDLTGGFGVDCSFLAQLFSEVHYVERQENLCQLAQHNFTALNLPHIHIHNTEATQFINTMPDVDFIYLDPARRDNYGRKTVAIADCEPNLMNLEEQLCTKSRICMAKLSPMLDIHEAIKNLKYISEVHIIAYQNECKEIILILSDRKSTRLNSSPEIQSRMPSSA